MATYVLNRIEEREFFCPISQMIMKDPVVADDGRTYERDAITQWQSLFKTSPFDAEKDMSSSFQPNEEIKGRIVAYLETVSSDDVLGVSGKAPSNSGSDDEASGTASGNQPIPQGKSINLDFNKRIPTNLRTFNVKRGSHFREEAKAIFDLLPEIRKISNDVSMIPQLVLLGVEGHGKLETLERLLGLDLTSDAIEKARVPIRFELKRGTNTVPTVTAVKVNAAQLVSAPVSNIDPVHLSSVSMTQEIENMVEHLTAKEVENAEATETSDVNDQSKETQEGFPYEIVVSFEHEDYVDLEVVCMPDIQQSLSVQEILKQVERTKSFVISHKSHCIFMPIHHCCTPIQQSPVIKLLSSLNLKDQSMLLFSNCDKYEMFTNSTLNSLQAASQEILGFKYGIRFVSANQQLEHQLLETEEPMQYSERSSYVEHLEHDFFQDNLNDADQHLGGIAAVSHEIFDCFGSFCKSFWFESEVERLRLLKDQLVNTILQHGFPFVHDSESIDPRLKHHIVTQSGLLSTVQFKVKKCIRAIQLADECSNYLIEAFEPLRRACHEWKLIQSHSSYNGKLSMKIIEDREAKRRHVESYLQDLRASFDDDQASWHVELVDTCMQRIIDGCGTLNLSRFEEFVKQLKCTIAAQIKAWRKACGDVFDDAVSLCNGSMKYDSNYIQSPIFINTIQLSSMSSSLYETVTTACLLELRHFANNLQATVVEYVDSLMDDTFKDSLQSLRLQALHQVHTTYEYERNLINFASNFGLNIRHEVHMLSVAEFDQLLDRMQITKKGKVSIRKIRDNTCGAFLSLNSNSVGDEGAKAIGEGLKRNSSLREISLESNEIGEEGSAAIGEGLKSNSSLRVLKLNSNSIGDEGAKTIGEALKTNSSLQAINLDSNRIGNEGAKAVGKALKSNSSLQTVQLGSNDIGDDGAKAVGIGLKGNSSLQAIFLYANRIGDEGAIAIGEGLKHNSSVVKIYLLLNKIGDQGARALAEAFKSNSTLRAICLKNNSIGDEGAKAIGEGLKSNASLQTLELGDNKIGDEGVRAIAEGLKFNSTLQEIHLDSNSIGHDGAKAIGEVLRNNISSIQTIHLQFNIIGNEGAKAIAEGLKSNSILETLDLRSNRISSPGASALVFVLANNSVLKALNLSGNSGISAENRVELTNASEFCDVLV